MFYRHWSGLPPDVTFPSDLKSLGYFVNEIDELRSIEDPEQYFRRFSNRNMRHNMRQRFAIDKALEEIIHERLTEQGLRKTPLPLGTPSDKKHVPIFVDNDLEKKSRIIVIFGETNNMLGQLAGRVVVGPGGISKGSMVSVVEEARQQARRDHESDGGNSDASAPGIVLANTGELYWWPNESRALTIGASTMLPLPSMVHHGWRFRKEVNEVQGHETPQKHVVSIFDQVLLPLAAKDAKIDVIAIGDTCELVEGFLDDEASWNTWGPRLSSMVLIDPICDASKLVNEGFRAFLKKRARCYLRSTEPVDTPLATPEGNSALWIGPLGAPCYSSSEPNYTECIMITALPQVLGYLERNARDPSAENEPITSVPTQREGDDDDEFVDSAISWGTGSAEGTDETWKKVNDDQKPAIDVFDPKMLDMQRKQTRMWTQFDEAGEAVDSDAEGEEGPKADEETKTSGEAKTNTEVDGV